MTHRGLLACGFLAAWTAAAQSPAVSGLAPTPTAPAATSADTPVPTPAPKLTGVAGPAPESSHGSQSLADVVRLSREARKGQPAKKSLGTITNENLHKGDAARAATPAKGTAKGVDRRARPRAHAAPDSGADVRRPPRRPGPERGRLAADHEPRARRSLSTPRSA